MVGLTLGNRKLAAIGTVATASGLALGAFWYKKYLKNKPPTKWMKIGEIGDMYIYPVKSCGFVQESSLEVTELGFKKGNLKDRMFLVLDLEGKVVYGMHTPKLYKITPSMVGTKLILSAEGCSETAEVEISNLKGETKRFLLLNSPSEGIDCGDEVALWLSRFILGEEKGLRLIYNGKENAPAKRVYKSVVAAAKIMDVELKDTDSGGFTGKTSFHLVSQASVDELQSRVPDRTVEALRFRPNLVVKGEKLIPFEEDNWEWVKVGDVIFRRLSPCFRCLQTTVDPATAIKGSDIEPLKTLRKYRMSRHETLRKSNGPAMGILMGLRSGGGSINLNDDVYIPA